MNESRDMIIVLYAKGCLNFKKLFNCLLSYLFAFLPSVNESACISTPSSALDAVSDLDLSHSNDYSLLLSFGISNPEYSLEGLRLRLNLQYFGHQM